MVIQASLCVYLDSVFGGEADPYSLAELRSSVAGLKMNMWSAYLSQKTFFFQIVVF